MSDYKIVQDIRGKKNALFRRRSATVISVQTGYTATIRIAGTTTNVSGVRYFSHVAPRPNQIVWFDTDGTDIVITGIVAGNGGAFPSCRVYRSSAQGVITTATNVLWNATDTDPWVMLDATNTDRINIPIDGLYAVTGVVAFALSATGTYRAVDVLLNTSTKQRTRTSNTTTQNVFLNFSTTLKAVKGDYVAIEASSDVYNVTLTSTGQMPNVSVSYLGPIA